VVFGFFIKLKVLIFLKRFFQLLLILDLIIFNNSNFDI
jgi:hypothetical protein